MKLLSRFFQNPSNWETKKFELLEATRTAIGEYLYFLDVMLVQQKLGKESNIYVSNFTAFLVQIFTINTTTSLISNMSPPKRAS